MEVKQVKAKDKAIAINGSNSYKYLQSNYVNTFFTHTRLHK